MFDYFQLCWTADISLSVSWPIHYLPQEGSYRLEYHPSIGFPPTNISYPATDVPSRIEISHALPGAEYQFAIYYSNFTMADVVVQRHSYITGWLLIFWTLVIITSDAVILY